MKIRFTTPRTGILIFTKRKELGLSPSQLAEKLKYVGASSVNAIEQGNEFPLERMTLLSTVLELPLDEIMIAYDHDYKEFKKESLLSDNQLN